MGILKSFSSFFIRDKEAKENAPSLISRATRVKPSSQNMLEAEIQDHGQWVPVQILNFSATGFSIDSFPREVETDIPFRMRLESASFQQELEASFTRKGPKNIGGKFLSHLDVMKFFTQQTYALELEASQLKKVNSSVMKSEMDGEPQWFFSPSNYELYFVANAVRVLRFHMAMEKFYLEWKNGKLSVGIIHRSEMKSSGMGVKASDLLQISENGPTSAQLDEARRFIFNIEGLEPRYSTALLEILKV